MFCPNCQFENPDDAKFCIECGSQLEFHCPNCGIITPVTGKFCKECGYDLKKPKEEPLPINYSEPQSYTPKHLTDKIFSTRSSVEGERKLVTVLFADVANYTALSEKLDPEEVHQIMDGCFKILMDEIHKYEGTINQFTGDGVMALFGAPVAHEDHAQRACRAALAIQKAMDGYGEKIEKDCNTEFKLRLGLNSGLVIVGAIGDDLRMDYTAVGDTTNLAMRVESMSEPGDIRISENTYRLIKAYFYCEDLGSVRVKGKEEPQRTYKLIKSSEVETRIEASVSRGLVRFVGRKNSMAAIQNAWDKAANGSGQVLGVVGEAGVGKSRLLLEFINSLKNGDFNYLEGRCLHYGGSMAYLPFLDITKAFFGMEEGQREYLINKNIKENLAALDGNLLLDSRPAFQDLLSLKVEEESWLKLDPKIKRERTFEALRNLFIRLSEEKQLIIAVEDLHWMDKTSEEFLNYFIDSMAHSPILLILLYRPEYTHHWGSKSYYSKIGLDQLTMDSSAELVSAILEGGEVASELKELILTRSAGNPLFLEEFTRTLLENGSIEWKNHQFVLSRKIVDVQVPDTIQGIIAARMDRLEENLKRTMQVASVIGRDFAFRILQTITGIREELKSYLLNLQGLEFIYEKSLFPELEYIFKHALTQEVAYNSLLSKRRKEIHEKIGQAIEKIYAGKLPEFYEMLAYHYSKSDNPRQAYHYFKLAGKKAIEKYSHWEAFGSFKAAIDALTRLPNDDFETKKAQVEIRLLLHVPMRQLFYPENSIKILEEGAKIANDIKDEKSLTQFYSQIGRYYSMSGDPLKGRNYQEECFQKAMELKDLDLLAPISDDLSLLCWATGEFYKYIEIAPKVISLIEEEQREADFFGRSSCIYVSAISALGIDLGAIGNFEQGESWLKKGLYFANKIQHSYSTGIVELFYSGFFLQKGEGEKCIAHAQNALKHFEDSKAISYLGIAKGFLGFGFYLAGNYEKALKFVKEGFKLHSGFNISFCLPYFGFMTGAIHIERGEFDEAHKSIRDSLHLSQKFNDRFSEGMSLIYLGRTKGKKIPPQFKKANDDIVSGIRLLKDLRLKPWVSLGYLFLGEIYSSSDEKDRALEYLINAEKNFQEMEMDTWLKKTREVMKKF